MLCAVKGRLPHQRGDEIRFAVAPGALDWNIWVDPGLSDSWWMEPHGETFAVSDVFFAEVGILHAICANTEQLFRVARGQGFRCDFTRHGYDSLVAALLGRH